MSFLRHTTQRMKGAQCPKSIVPSILRGLILSLNGCPPAEPFSVSNQASQTKTLSCIFTTCPENGKLTIKDLTRDPILAQHVDVKADDPIEIMKIMKAAHHTVTIYRVNSNKIVNGIRARAYNFLDKNNSRNNIIHLDRSLGDVSKRETSLYNEVGDIFFKIRFGFHKQADDELKATHKKPGVSDQEAYLRAYHNLYQEKFSSYLQAQFRKL